MTLKKKFQFYFVALINLNRDMENQNPNATIRASFILDVLTLCETKFHDLISELLECLAYDVSNPENKVPITSYYAMCELLEAKIGKLQIKIIARNLGLEIYDKMVKQKIIEARPKPLEMVKGYIQYMKQFAEGGTWDVVDSGSEFVLIQDNLFCTPTIQNGIFEAIISKCGKVLYQFQSQRKSSPELSRFDQMMVTWKNWKN